MSDATVTIAALALHPVKSCAGIEVPSALVDATGLEFDRTWMLVDEHDSFVTQRELPTLALVRPTLKASELVLRAPGMLALHVQIDVVESPRRVRVWDDAVDAWDVGDLAAQWFSDFTGRRLRLVRFDPEVRRLASRQWTGALEAETAFADAFPLLVCSSAGLAELNRRLAERGHAPVEMRRFRPNLVLDGLDAHGEDWIHTLAFATPDGPVTLKLVKPCARCPIPNVDPDTGTRESDEPLATLSTYRADPRLGGAVTFGMNAIVVEGVGRTLRVGMAGEATLAV